MVDDGKIKMHATFQPRGTHPPMSNAERQREFRRRNPDYYKRYRARMKAETQARVAQRLVEAQAAAPAPATPEGVWITLPAMAPVEAAKPAAAAPKAMRFVEG